MVCAYGCGVGGAEWAVGVVLLMFVVCCLIAYLLNCVIVCFVCLCISCVCVDCLIIFCFLIV